MKRELKVLQDRALAYGLIFIARLIPMKRELKASKSLVAHNWHPYNRKAHPDEKGTERTNYTKCDIFFNANRKAHPDEKGTESFSEWNPGQWLRNYRKAHPDEKGTESVPHAAWCVKKFEIARLIPMKRELKGN